MKLARLQKLHKTVDRQAAERVRIVPQQAGGYVPGGADPYRAPVEIEAFLAETSAAVMTSGNAANSGHNPRLVGVTHTAKFSTALVPFAILAGDLVEPVDDTSLPTFRVSSALPFGWGRTVLTLTVAAS